MTAYNALKYTIAIAGLAYTFWLLLQGLRHHKGRKYGRAIAAFLVTALLVYLMSIAEFYYYLHS